MGKSPAFPLYASDFDMDTATWENDEIGAYLRLLIYEWVNGGLPDDTYKLAKIVRESERKFKEKWKNLSEKFHLNGNGLLVNSRMEEVREEREQFIESQREKGVKSAKKRWGNRVTPVITTVTERLQPDCNLSSSSSSSSSKKKRLMYDCPFFSKFWDAYPKKIGRKKALEEWVRIKPTPDDKFTERVIATIQKFKQTDQWAKDRGQYIPLPSTWLHQGRWDDEPQSSTTRHFETPQEKLMDQLVNMEIKHGHTKPA